MKYLIKTVLLSILLTSVAIFSGCETSGNKVENAQANLQESKDALKQANADYQADVKAYRKEKADMISANEATILSLKSKIANEKASMRAGYEREITDLEQKNKSLKVKIDGYKDNGKENWESFKREFNHDMEELGKAFKDLTVNNKK